jgi:nicotinate phosphoribosyltransferase
MSKIIKSLLENDLYKFTMQQLVLRKFPEVKVRYRFINRGGTKFPNSFSERLLDQIKVLGSLKFKHDELKYLKDSCPFLKKTYIEWLSSFSPNPDHVKISQEKDDLKIILEGPWYQTIYWEVPLMAIISELYFLAKGIKPYGEYKKEAEKKALLLKNFGCTFADFGLRRRFSSKVQNQVVKNLNRHSKNPGDEGGFVGTSNVYLAYKYGLRPIGTMAHELAMVFSAIYGFRSANKMLLKHWSEEFGGELGIALSDTFTTKVFLRDFNRKMALLFDGLRQDSGSPEKFVDITTTHYKKLGIDPRTKTIIFSDGLIPSRVVQIKKYCEGKIKSSFGIGTNFTNDVGTKPLNIVIKAVAAKKPKWPWVDIIKLSDAPGKITGNEETTKIAKKLLGIN